MVGAVQGLARRVSSGAERGVLTAASRGTAYSFGRALLRWILACAFLGLGLLTGCSDSPVQAPVISAQPTDTAAAAGTAATLSISASGADISYQWQLSTDAGGTWSNLAAATTASYTSPTLSTADSGKRYRVVVTAAGVSINSSAVTLTVTAAVVAPSITMAPAAQSPTAPAAAAFSVTATGTALAYQWQRSTDAGTTWQSIAGATSATYDTGATSTTMNNERYRVVVSNSTGSVTSAAATLSVVVAPAAPAITTQPSDQSAVVGASVAFSVVATGTPAPTLQWQRSTDLGVSWTNISAATASIYNTGAVVLSQDSERYRVVVSNSAGTVNSSAARLSVTPAPQAPAITTQPSSQSVTAPATATFTGAASGVPTPTWQWQLSTDSGSTWANLNGATAATYTTPATVVGDNGKRFRAVASNSAGSTTSQGAVLTVNAAPPSALAGIVRASATGNGGTALLGYGPSLSADGTRVAFIDQYQGYVRDLQAQTLARVNLKQDGTPSPGGLIFLKLAAGGRFAVFTSFANDLVAGDTNIASDTFVRDLQTGTTTRVNVSSTGQDTVSGNGSGYPADISADGRWILMYSEARLDADGRYDLSNCLYLRDQASGQTVQILNAGCVAGRISANGRYVLFYSSTGIDSNYTQHLQLYDNHPTDPTQRVTTTLASYLGNTFNGLAISDDGKVIAFDASPSRIEPGATSTDPQIYVIDRSVSATPVSVSAAVGGRNQVPSLSGDGRYVAFNNATAGSYPVVHDRVTGTTRRVQKPSSGFASGSEAVLSSDGAVLGFTSFDPDLASRPSVGSEVFVAPRP